MQRSHLIEIHCIFMMKDLHKIASEIRNYTLNINVPLTSHDLVNETQHFVCNIPMWSSAMATY